jgi:hypothetical protein
MDSCLSLINSIPESETTSVLISDRKLNPIWRQHGSKPTATANTSPWSCQSHQLLFPSQAPSAAAHCVDTQQVNWRLLSRLSPATQRRPELMSLIFRIMQLRGTGLATSAQDAVRTCWTLINVTARGVSALESWPRLKGF